VLVAFRIAGNLRFLSHAQTLSLFQRACVRAGINLCYSQGYNPRPRLSLPLPRSVGVEADDELLALAVNRAPGGASADELAAETAAGLGAEMPEGCRILGARPAATGRIPIPASAVYTFVVRPEYHNRHLGRRIEELLASPTLVLHRKKHGRGSSTKTIDVRELIKSLELLDDCVRVEARISQAGSIRVEEMLELLGLSRQMLARPIRRTCVRWRCN